jgi:AAA ATPase domain
MAPDAMPSLLERDAELGALRAAVGDARGGRGSVVLIGGEAGIGKTSLVRALRAETGGALVGRCEPLSAAGPFALCGRDALREFFATAGLTVEEMTDVPCTFAYPDLPTALAALASAGPVARIAEHAGQQAVDDDIRAFLAPHARADGSYAIVNPFRYAMSAPVE